MTFFLMDASNGDDGDNYVPVSGSDDDDDDDGA